MADPFDFSCPACDAPGRARLEWAGRQVRCKHCKSTFTLPSPGEAAADAYDLADPVAIATGPMPLAAPIGDVRSSTFTRSFRDAPLPDVPRDLARRRRGRERSPREELIAWRADHRVRILAGLASLGAVVAVATFVVPGFGVMGGWALTVMGMLLVAVGFFVGAYAAFREDFLHGFAYVVFPIYTGYYLVTRFDDLWPWLGASTVGFVLFTIGTRALEVGGAF